MAITTNKNFLQPSGFAISISRENYPNLEYFAKSVSLPSVDVSSADMPVRRSVLPNAGDTIIYGSLDMEVAVDEDLKSYEEMHVWMLNLVNKNYVSSFKSTQATRDPDDATNAANLVPTEADIRISILSSHNNVNRYFKFFQCVPISIGGLELNTEAGAETPLTFPVSFRFTQYELL